MGSPHGPKNLEDFIAINEMEVSNLLLTHKPAKKNLTKEESQALSDLSKDTHITIKPADKGGAIVIQNTGDYVKEGMRQLNDITTYERLRYDPVLEYTELVDEKIMNMVAEGEITPNMAGALGTSNPSLHISTSYPKSTRG